jgi:hypothetical protein
LGPAGSPELPVTEAVHYRNSLESLADQTIRMVGSGIEIFGILIIVTSIA